MKKITVFLYFFFTIFYLVFPIPTSAHVLKTDNTVGGVIHIDPEDDPYVGEPSGIYIELKDKENNFGISKCDCALTILRKTEVLETLPLEPSNDNDTSSSNVFTFPTKGVYTLRVEGKPLEGQSFQPFTFSYDFRVQRERPPSIPKESPNLILPFFGIIGALVLIVLAAWILGMHFRRSKK